MRTIRTVLRRGNAPRTVLTLLGALALIVGVLGMHTFAEGIESATIAPVSMSAVSADVVEPMVAPAAQQSAMLDALMPAMTAMTDACVLALLVGLLLLVLPPTTGLPRLAPRADAARTFLAVGTLEPRPPSLSVLSISRV
jgi:hypothetical protein